VYPIDSRFLEGNTRIASWPLSELLLANNALYPWFVLVPRVEGARELIDLTTAQQQLLLVESNALQHWLLARFKPDKLNVGMLGNIVDTLHIHHIGRFKGDAAWPGPVWGHAAAAVYSAAEVSNITDDVSVITRNLMANYQREA